MTTFSPQRSRPAAQIACTAVLAIDGLPRSLRMHVEQLMVECIPSPAELYVPGVDPLTAAWCTRWERSSSDRRKVACRQVLTGSLAELKLFDARLAELAGECGCQAGLRIVD